MARDPSKFMPFWIGDYLAGTMHLTTLEHGAYFLLLLHYWSKGEPLPDDDRSLATIAKLSTKVWLTLSRRVRDFFSPEVRDGNPVLVHVRCEEELARARIAYQKAVEDGARGAEKRWGAHSHPNRVTNGKGNTNHNHNNNTDRLSRTAASAAPPKRAALPPSELWGGKALELAQRISPAKFEAYFAPPIASFSPGPPAVLTFANTVMLKRVNSVATNLLGSVHAVFGSDTILAAAPQTVPTPDAKKDGSVSV